MLLLVVVVVLVQSLNWHLAYRPRDNYSSNTRRRALSL